MLFTRTGKGLLHAGGVGNITGAGKAADFVLFDQAAIGSPERGSFIYDLPTGAGRLHAKAQGISRIVVNGRSLYRDGKPTGDLPGSVVSSA